MAATDRPAVALLAATSSFLLLLKHQRGSELGPSSRSWASQMVRRTSLTVGTRRSSS